MLPLETVDGARPSGQYSMSTTSLPLSRVLVLGPGPWNCGAGTPNSRQSPISFVSQLPMPHKVSAAAFTFLRSLTSTTDQLHGPPAVPARSWTA